MDGVRIRSHDKSAGRSTPYAGKSGKGKGGLKMMIIAGHIEKRTTNDSSGYDLSVDGVRFDELS